MRIAESDDTELALMKFGIGQPVLRTEDPTLVRGQGRYTDDVNVPGQAYAVMVRSRAAAHGILEGDRRLQKARTMQGVLLAILTAADLDVKRVSSPLMCATQHPAARRHAR